MDVNQMAQCWSALFKDQPANRGDELREQFAFLKSLRPSPKRIFNLGCAAKWREGVGYEGGLEPFALMWTLGASKVVVADKNEDSICVLRRHIGELKKKHPKCFTGSFECFVLDITNEKQVSRIPSANFDLAYCSRVLLGIAQSDGLQGVRKAIAQIARLVQMGGWAVSHEAGACQPYPERYRRMFMEVGFGEPCIRKLPELISLPAFTIEYAVYQRVPRLNGG